jgi:DNA-binding transcriptional LysR family regulator
MGWSVITHRGHRLAVKRRVALEDTAMEPLILYERGSTGRQHILDAFHELHLIPHVAFETTSTETIVSMVEAGLGVSIVPLLRSGVVTKGRRVHVRALKGAIRPIHSGILSRRGERRLSATSRLVRFMRARYNKE